ncbi:hypothetical protein BV372_16015 [Nostoc sp. T09]|uniref:hypothetical protein n=1 Tax=Nostoc sp. T09 TaxID=1932621 RepID=UPI000A389512|nr:hypothetical protein [Nostoc sp. T09]OUL33516.1 hypothetical protein BV372_16015 [Nostoc sp. T09]
MDKDQLYWGMYQEHVTQARQHENQRERMTSLVVGITTAALAFAAQNGLTWTDLLLTVPLIPLGIFGAQFCRKHYERNRYHVSVSAAYLKNIDPSIYETRDRTKNIHDQDDKYKHIVPKRLNIFWERLHYAVAILGILVSLTIVGTQLV